MIFSFPLWENRKNELFTHYAFLFNGHHNLLQAIIVLYIVPVPVKLTLAVAKVYLHHSIDYNNKIIVKMWQSWHNTISYLENITSTLPYVNMAEVRLRCLYE